MTRLDSTYPGSLAAFSVDLCIWWPTVWDGTQIERVMKDFGCQWDLLNFPISQVSTSTIT